MKISINPVSSEEDIQACLDIRKKVFVEGQQVPIEEELDGKDKSSAHYLLSLDDQPIGVARVRLVDGVAKIERVAILEEHQGKGYGCQLMTGILSHLKHQGILNVKLSSQTYAIPFYEKLGFIVCSEEYMDAGIPHKDMMLS